MHQRRANLITLGLLSVVLAATAFVVVEIVSLQRSAPGGEAVELIVDRAPVVVQAMEPVEPRRHVPPANIVKPFY